MNTIDRLFTLKPFPGFRALSDAEMLILCQVVQETRLEPGKMVASSGMPLSRLIVVERGGIVSEDGTPLPSMIGAPSLLFDWRLSSGLYASPDSEARCLTLHRGHFYTLIHECPAFLIDASSHLEPGWLYDHAPAEEQ